MLVSRWQLLSHGRKSPRIRGEITNPTRSCNFINRSSNTDVGCGGSFRGLNWISLTWLDELVSLMFLFSTREGECIVCMLLSSPRIFVLSSSGKELNVFNKGSSEPVFIQHDHDHDSEYMKFIRYSNTDLGGYPA